MTAPSPDLEPGVAMIHGNQMEQLRQVAVHWLSAHPLTPLEDEIILVQSSGMGQWLKLGLAETSGLGIMAAVRLQLPSTFTWQAYRAVLGASLPTQQPLAKPLLRWRLYRLLPKLVTQPEFTALAHCLGPEASSLKRFRLAGQLADLFDQYQMYRADWLADWQEGTDVLQQAHLSAPVPEAQRWQPALWRAVLADLGTNLASRAQIHQTFLQQLASLEQRPEGLPRRVMVFGVSAMPSQILEVLAGLGRFCQVLVFVHNPCRYYWADLIEGKALFNTARRRQPHKTGLNLDDPGLLTAPLLAAWGQQGRDYIRMLDAFDEQVRYRDWHWPEQKIDLFQDYGDHPDQRSLLERLQQSVLDLETLPQTPAMLITLDDSICLHSTHSRQREVEILHDQLLAMFEQAAAQGQPLAPEDIMVMTPDIDAYAPHIDAVFGALDANDSRFIPYRLTNILQRGRQPILLALEHLLNLPNARYTVSDALALLDVAALRARFDLNSQALPKLRQWLTEAGVRWGLDAVQRRQIVNGLPEQLDTNSWRFGLERMLLGYAVGAGQAFAGIEPYPEIGGLEAVWLGSLIDLVNTLERYQQQLSQAHSSTDWQTLLTALLADFFQPDSDTDQRVLDHALTALEDWHRQIQDAGLNETDTLPLEVVRDAWLEAIDTPSLQQRFLGGGITFGTLMPMRAIPFQMVCLLGMNDGDYPRTPQRPGFDLMAERGQYRPGDRSRRKDDHYLFLEALLSARRRLYISWQGRDPRDNSARPPSVLVSQLRDTLQRGWQLPDDQDLLDAITLEHPLQPFSQAYVQPGRNPRLFTYAREWFAPPAKATGQPASPPPPLPKHLPLNALAGFIKHPVRYFCRETLKIHLDQARPAEQDNETFSLDGLLQYQLKNLLLPALNSPDITTLEHDLDAQQHKLSAQGLLPWAGFGDAAFQPARTTLVEVFSRYQALIQQAPTPLPKQPLSLSLNALNLSGVLSQLRQTSSGELWTIAVNAANLADKSGKNLYYHKLLDAWVIHLAACANSHALTTWLVGADRTLSLAPLPPEQARNHLDTLLDAYQQGLARPLPIACKTAFAWLTTAPEQAERKALESYQNDANHRPSEVDDPYLARFYPDFARLTDPNHTPSFPTWAERLYQPLLDAIR
ncbi:MAG: exodeoxyribonuclease V subunit gamma [Methylococcales bacterium]|nr:exodeoxyribonuclease V subunit gamma [Methylococcales bacterium]